MWTPATRAQHSRDGLRYSTDLTDAEWDVIAPLLPSAKPLGRPRLWSLRKVVNGIFFVLCGGVPWRLLPKDLPPKSTVYGDFTAWRDSGLFADINHHLVMLDRERVGRDASLTAAVLDSQSVKTTESGGPRGYDVGKKVKGRKRQVLVDTDGRALVLDPQPADVQDRDGAVPGLKRSRRSDPFIAKAFADAGYAGDKPNSATLIAVEIVRKQPGQIGFVVHPRRWVVERFFAWISRNRRLWRDPEATIASAKAFHWVFRCEEAVVHHAAPTRGACVVHEIMDGHRPAVWLSDRYSAQQGHADRQQTCLPHLALARTITAAAPSTVTTKRRKLERSLGDILATPATCDLARDIQSRMRRARDQLLPFASFPGRVEAHNNACERDLRPAVIQRKNTNGYRAMWSAKGEAAVRTVVATARITSGAGTFSTVLGTIGA